MDVPYAEECVKILVEAEGRASDVVVRVSRPLRALDAGVLGSAAGAIGNGERLPS